MKSVELRIENRMEVDYKQGLCSHTGAGWNKVPCVMMTISANST